MPRSSRTVTRWAGTPRTAKFVSVDTGGYSKERGSGRSARRDGLGCEVSRRKSESTGPATLRQAKKKRPEAELGGPLSTSLPEGDPCRCTDPVPRSLAADLPCLSDIPRERRSGNGKTCDGRHSASLPSKIRRRRTPRERADLLLSRTTRGNHMSSKIRAITAVVAACTTATAFSALTASSASAHGSGDGPAHSPKVLNSTRHRAVRDGDLGPGRLVHRRIRRHRQQDLEGDRHGRHDGARSPRSPASTSSRGARPMPSRRPTTTTAPRR